VDDSPKHVLQELAESCPPGRLLVAESNRIEPVLTERYGLDAQWNDDFHHAVHTLLTGERDGYYADYGRLAQLQRSLEEGYVYDSSPTDLRPGSDSASEAGGPSIPHYVDGSAGMLVRFPIPTTRWWGLRLPVSGGEHFRYTPYAVTRDAFRDHTRSGVPGVFFLRAWEVDSAPPRPGVPLVARIRHRWGVGGMMDKVEQLLIEFHFSSCARVLDDAYTAGSRGPVFPTPAP
jgi:hypothetical protein